MQLPMLNGSIHAFFMLGVAILALPGCASKAEQANEAYVAAQQYMAYNNLVDARRELLRAVALRDDVAEVWAALGQVHLTTGALPDAFTAFTRADELRPGDATTLRPLAYTGYMIGATRLAQDATDRLLALSAADPQGLAVKGLLALDKGDTEVSLAAANGILAAAPNDETGLMLKARAMAVDGKIDEAIALLETAIKTSDARSGLSMSLLQFYRAKGNVSGMMSVFPTLLTVQKDNADFALDYSNLLYRTGKPDEARKIWSDTVLTRPKDGKFLAWAFEVYDYAEPLDRAPALDPRIVRSGPSALRSAAAQYLIARQGYASAASLLARGGLADTDRGLYAVALEGLGKRSEADALVDTILAGDKAAQDPNALMLRAKRLVAAGKFERASADAQTAVVADPSNLPARLVLADAYRASDQPLRVRQVLAEAVRDLPRNRRALSIYLQFLHASGDHASAIAVARNSADANTTQPWNWQMLATTCQKAGDAACVINAKRRYDIALRDYSFTNPARPFKMRGLFSPLPTPG